MSSLISEKDLALTVQSLTDFDGHEEILLARDETSGLSALIAVHNTYRGPGVGGTRLWKYDDERSAVTDVLRLSRGMTYKNAIAELPFGGGKAVILAPDFSKVKRAEMMQAFGRAISLLEGRYYTAEDVGTSCKDMEDVSKETNYLFGREETSGDPSPHTARGVLLGMEASARRRLGVDSLRDLRVIVQGVGNVGYHLCRMLHERGARLTVSDLDRSALDRCAQEFSAEVVSPDAIYDVPGEIYAPCALGATVNAETLDRLQVFIIAGAANNQLKDEKIAGSLRQLDILYAPDYVINAGGIINISVEMKGRYCPDLARVEVAKITPRIEELYARAEAEDKTTVAVADEMARERFCKKSGEVIRVTDLASPKPEALLS